MKQRQHAIRLLTTMMLTVPLAIGAMAQDADELAQLIQQNIEDIEVQVRVAPAKAEEDLQHQKQQLDTLRSEAPDHLLLPSLERRIAELEAEIAAARQQQPAAVEGTEQFVPMHAPAEVRRRLRHVETLQTRADREIMRGAPESAVNYLSEADDLRRPNTAIASRLATPRCWSPKNAAPRCTTSSPAHRRTEPRRAGPARSAQERPATRPPPGSPRREPPRPARPPGRGRGRRTWPGRGPAARCRRAAASRNRE